MFPAPKKSLGQNFLNSPKALADILRVSEVSAADTVLEIGPGRGALTAELLQTGAKVIAIEKDETLAGHLRGMFMREIESGQFEIVEGDVLEVGGEVVKKLESYKLIANIPYYITGQIFRMFLEGDTSVGGAMHQPSLITLLVQKEVADRVVARDGKESILSMSVKAYGTPLYVSKVLAGSFVPAPNVDSAILCIKDISKKFFVDNGITEEKFFAVMKAGFAHKRKMLAGNLREEGFVLPESYMSDPTGKKQKARAEDLALDAWIDIVKANS